MKYFQSTFLAVALICCILVSSQRGSAQVMPPVPGPPLCDVFNNEELNMCGDGCQPTCDTLGQMCERGPQVCNVGCYCTMGHARNAMNRCIPIAQCYINGTQGPKEAAAHPKKKQQSKPKRTTPKPQKPAPKQ